MPFTVKSFAAHSSDTPLKLHELERRDVQDNDVQIKIMYTGVCHSDMHVAHNDWNGSNYPVIPGHEIVGEVEKLGKNATEFKVGQIVAVGCMVDSCGECKMCKIDQETFCFKGMTQTYNDPETQFPGHYTAGGYSQKIVVQKHFVLRVPDGLLDKELLPGVAPILCAGITTYSPLNQYGVTKGSKVGVIGLGGLGHMAIKLAKALGAEVTLISRSHKKDEYAKSLGAHHVVASTDEKEMAGVAGEFDLIVDTIPFEHDINIYIPTVAPFGTLCIVGQLGPLSKPLNSVGLVFGNKRVSGSAIGGIKETQELLELCAEKKVIADYKMIRMEDINEAWEQMNTGDIAHRFIIETKEFQ